MKNKLKTLLSDFKENKISEEKLIDYIQHLPFENMDFAHVDHHRELRQGFPEVIFCEGKSYDQIEKIIGAILKQKSSVLASRAGKDIYQKLKKKYPKLKYNEPGRIIFSDPGKIDKDFENKLLILSAGTSDIPVAEEAYQTAYSMGFKAKKIYDVGVSGIHRLLYYKEELDKANIIIVVAGMEGALASVVGGLSKVPIIAVPTSVGYGTAFGGVTALLAMLNSCASGVTVVNIDNGFGAAFAAAKYLRQLSEK